MNNILVCKVNLDGKNLYTEEVVNLLTLGNSTRHQLFVGEHTGAPVVFHKTAQIYSAQFKDDSWKINKKTTIPNKLYVLDKNTVIHAGELKVTFSIISEDQVDNIKDATPMTRRQNIADLLKNTKVKPSAEKTKPAQNFLSKIKSSVGVQSEKESSDNSKKLGKPSITKKVAEKKDDEIKLSGLVNLPSNIFNLSLTYFIYTFSNEILNKLKLSKYNFEEKYEEIIFTFLKTYLPINQFEGVLKSLTNKLPISFDTGNIEIINSTILEIITTVLVFISLMALLKVIQCLIFGAPLSFFLMGISIDGNVFTRRLKASLREVLALVLFPLNIINPFGVIPLKSVPDFILRTIFLKKSSSLSFIGIILNILVSLIIIVSPLFYFGLNSPKKVSATVPYLKKSIIKNKRENLRPTLIKLIGNESIELMLPESLRIENVGIKNSLPYTILTDGKNEITISSLNLSPLEGKIEKKFLDKFPLGIVLYPANFFATKIKKNEGFYLGTKNRRLVEKQKIIYSSSLPSLNQDSILYFIKLNGPFFKGASHVKSMLKKVINLNSAYSVDQVTISSLPFVLFDTGEISYLIHIGDENFIGFEVNSSDKLAVQKLINSIIEEQSDEITEEAKYESLPSDSPNGEKMFNQLKDLQNKIFDSVKINDK